ncbi:DUF5694 domain-containing protein [Psychrobacillus sp.]|uniref:DUF5694 domain-containing protein n=1 Tax=Psychrobacillus sp. TaxID=1871623 RepID=UPI0028BF1E01|nr:DUF5694 domain-containing protein [Psychrobacillus sp.]
MGKKEILLVGTFHFEALQQVIEGKGEEVLEIVDFLSEYKPTKIAVEYERKEQQQLNDLYKKQNGDYAINEIEQLGFRIARKLQHQEIFAVNWEGKLTQEDVISINEAILSDYPNISDKFSTYSEKLTDIILNSNLLNTYKKINDEALVQETEKIYLSYVTVENNNEFIGVSYLNKWIERELIIFKNVTEIAIDTEERILLIVGMDHLWMLKKFFEGNGWNVINPFQNSVH